MPREIGDQLAAVRRMHHLGVELRGVETLFFIRGHGEGRALAHRDHFETGGELRHLVAVAHPHLMPLAFGPQAVEQGAPLLHLDEGAAELAAFAAFDIAAHLLHHRLLAIADAQDRDARVKEGLRRAWAVLPHDGRWAARQDDALWLEPLERFGGAVEGRDFGIDARLAYAPRDQLRHLAAEVHDKDGILKGQRHRIAFVSQKKRDGARLVRPLRYVQFTPASLRRSRTALQPAPAVPPPIPAEPRRPERPLRSGRRCR
ncbi:hypothetical protein BV98_003163 [Sphingobium herbicidovorans NBRC 16415]|uniref:Uncharacterized protein n=1 Tax=Sphingobium herbicidovorans (strain ATCC 700291 / DSM 11019 / CCUG 56400 / KCTC 2939 / LMG 18315 / NBRC 16415 / MH) TaxID=1219045 RepID=A0A086P6Q2_SPHHM|nr:hypothetical protein BV98_003163 [Sphingobium herbicidovorans NBRC 16415]